MTRRHAAYQLLRHGPLTLDEAATITGWPRRVVGKTFWHLAEQGLVKFTGTSQRGMYEVVL